MILQTFSENQDKRGENMDFLLALGIMTLSLIICIFSTLITIIVGIRLANYLGLTGIVWWSFVILFWMIVTSILRYNSK